ncbi:sodium:solute symporter [Microscilla marina]|uniref:Sodium-coupled permease, putative n=1 Tax=Microscilla marina ATCC 23134 TaxID=313606 RepID=A1ZF75_MICM2|nr:sodium:solute symporter [Microscilla marina]EAY31177.1 sodium-coupled permease, putative [Microscilla marina ATCC 23134]
MGTLDWVVLILTQLLIVGYGLWKSQGSKNMQAYLLGNREMTWFTIGLSIMATQASAITFLSAPGLGYDDGMRFVQFYFGLPLAMVVISAVIVPIYRRLNVYTAYEYLEKRFDLRTRAFAAFLFLLQRGLAAGFTIFAPSLILSALLGWNIYWTNFFTGLVVIIYTVSGGTKAVSQTQKIQMVIILFGMVVAGYMVVNGLPKEVSFNDALHLAGKMGKLNVVDFEVDLTTKYNFWSGIIGGFFLALSYFGTDQSQVQRYLGGQSAAQSRLGLLFNGMIKIPMQFAILFIGVMMFVFYMFQAPPISFKRNLVENTRNSEYKQEFKALEQAYDKNSADKKAYALAMVKARKEKNYDAEQAAVAGLRASEKKAKEIKGKANAVMVKADNTADTRDINYIFISYVMKYLPLGLVGLLVSVIISASMSSTASELNALASTTVIDIYKRMIKPEASDQHYLRMSKVLTIGWGLYAIVLSMFANRLGALIEAVNLIGSLVYGTILGIFLVAFFLKKVGSKEVFIAAVFSELLVIYCHTSQYINAFFAARGVDVGWFFPNINIPFLWYNVIGCLPLIFVAWLLHQSKLLKK